jgi:F-type H+-transporting ATPase subunit delta
MNYEVEPELIGGMVIRIEDRVIDSSIRTQLFEMKKSLSKIQL